MDQIRSVSRVANQLVRFARSVGLAVLLAGCAASTVHFSAPPPAQEDNSLGPGDVFGVRVFGEADMSQDYRIAPDGTIDFPYLGTQRVAGLDPTQVERLIRAQLEQHQILRQPQVSVIIRESHSRMVNVVGQVAHQGVIPFEQNMTILQAITHAGGFTPLAQQRSVRLTRHVRGGGTASYEIPVNLIVEGRLHDVPLAPGDVIFVPESAI